MKKSTFTLAIRRETLRVLAGMELVGVAGGGGPDGQQFDTGNAGTGCPNVNAPLAAPTGKP